jgi:hypothetical protein
MIVLLTPISRAAGFQIQIGTLKVTVTDPSGAVVQAAQLLLSNRLTGYRQNLSTDQTGSAVFNNVPFDEYRLTVEAPRFEISSRTVAVRSNLPVEVQIKLAVRGAAETVDVQADAELIRRDSTGTSFNVDASSVNRAPGALRNVQGIISTLPGWASENDGLLHIRGVDDGMLFVIDGVPVADRQDRVFAGGPDPETISSMSVLTGNIPAEFGGRSGAVIVIQPRSGIDRRLTGTLDLAAGEFGGRYISGSLAGGSKNAGFFLEVSTGRTNRFLDPVDERNFNNRGGIAGINARVDWHPSTSDILIFNSSVTGSDFHVSNTEAQELAGQHQRQELRDNAQSLSWQRVWSESAVSNFAIFHRRQRARLIGSQFDTPLFAAQNRYHDRFGILASVTREYRGHTIKGGFEAQRITPHESFQFAITDPDEAEEAGITDEALEFDSNNPFVFRDRKTRGQFSGFIQDQFSAANLTVTAGLRYDHSWLLASDQQFSPRIGAVYYFTRTRTSIRGSFNRLFMPPQVENLLLADSEQARALSPFESETGGGAIVLPEKTSAYEAGVAQDFRGWLRLDVAAWRRNVRNFDDPNVFFSTTIVFPNSVASGYARGVDFRLDVPEHRGWSGYLSYTNQRVLQTGPINGGLFLTDEAIEIGPGTDFIPDHDERNIGAAGVMYRHQRSGIWAALSGRHESGVPLEVEDEAIEDLKQRPGADLVDFERRRVKPWTVFGFSAGGDVVRLDRVRVGLQFDVQNLADRRFAYNFGNPFSGTHFGSPRVFSARLKLTFR